MSKIWKEKADPKKHIDFMSTAQTEGLPLEFSRFKNTPWVYFVRECSFTFQFVALEQLKECLDWFEQKIHPSSREYNNGLEHYWQLWYERLPKGLTRESKRIKIVKALKKAHEEFSKDYQPVFMNKNSEIRTFKQVLATDSGMWGIWDMKEYAYIMNYDDWEKVFLEDTFMERQIMNHKFVPITIHSDGVLEFETRVGTMGEPAMLSEDEKKMVVVASEKYGLNASGKVGVSGIEHIDGKFQEESVCIIPLQGWYSAVVYLVDREKNPDAPDFIILLNQEAGYSHQFSMRLETFERKI